MRTGLDQHKDAHKQEKKFTWDEPRQPSRKDTYGSIPWASPSNARTRCAWMGRRTSSMAAASYAPTRKTRTKIHEQIWGKKAGVDIAHTRQKAGVGPVAAVSALSTNLSI